MQNSIKDKKSTKIISKQKIVKKMLNSRISLMTQQLLNFQQTQNIELDELEVSDYIKLLSDQKKCLSNRRWYRMIYYNQHETINQQIFKPFIMVISQAHYLKLDSPGYYQFILSQNQNFPDLYFTTIEKDIPRTLVNGHPFQQPLRNVLKAYAIRNPPLVYCQGMNYLVAFLLINSFSEEEAFWFLTCLIEQILPHNYFKDLGTISIASLVFNDILEEMFSDFADRMKEVGIESSMYLVSWYVCLFTKGFLNSVSHYMLAFILINSRKYEIGYLLVYLSLGVMNAVLNRKVSLTFQNSQLNNHSVYKEEFDVGVNSLSLESIKQSLRSITLDYNNFMILYNYYKQKRDEKIEQAVKHNLIQSKFTLPLCNLNYPICLQRIEIQKKVGNVEQVHILKVATPIQQLCLQNYFQSSTQLLNSQKMFIKSVDDCLLNRRPHICSSKVKSSRSTFNQQACDMNELVRRPSSIQDRFEQLSQFFTVDPEFQYKKDILEQQINAETNIKPRLGGSISLTLKKVIKGLKMLREK